MKAELFETDVAGRLPHQKEAALPVMVEARPGWRRGDRSVLEGSDRVGATILKGGGFGRRGLPSFEEEIMPCPGELQQLHSPELGFPGSELWVERTEKVSSRFRPSS